MPSLFFLESHFSGRASGTLRSGVTSPTPNPITPTTQPTPRPALDPSASARGTLCRVAKGVKGDAHARPAVLQSSAAVHRGCSGGALVAAGQPLCSDDRSPGRPGEGRSGWHVFLKWGTAQPFQGSK